jgi:hypothetical protein
MPLIDPMPSDHRFAGLGERARLASRRSYRARQMCLFPALGL